MRPGPGGQEPGPGPGTGSSEQPICQITPRSRQEAEMLIVMGWLVAHMGGMAWPVATAFPALRGEQQLWVGLAPTAARYLN